MLYYLCPTWRGDLSERWIRASAENVRNQVTAKCGMTASMKVNSTILREGPGVVKCNIYSRLPNPCASVASLEYGMVV